MRVLAQVSADPKTRPEVQARANAPRTAPGPHAAQASVAPVPATRSFALDRIAIHPPAADPLRIGTPDDPGEREADRLADAVLKPQPSAPQRCACGGIVEGGGECAACRRKRLGTLRRNPATMHPVAAREPDTGAHRPAPAIVHDALRAPGRPLDAATRAFMEPRLGADFRAVRIHTGSLAEASADAVGALAYSVGSHIVFDAGRFNPTSTEGRRLLAHELAHVIQSDAAGAGARPVLRPRLKVMNPAGHIPNPDGTGRRITNREQITEYVETLCDSPFAGISIGSGGDVTSTLCDDPTLIPGVIDRTVHGCTCLCDVINDSHMIAIMVDDTTGPHTSMGAGAVRPGVGSDADIVIWSDNATKGIGTPTVSGRLTSVPQWLALGHEMCGHAWLGMQGREDPGPEWTGLPGHVPATERENLIRREHGIEARAIWREPYCGEGFEFGRAGGMPGTPDAIQAEFPDWLRNCRAWRSSLNWLNCTDYKLSDTIPEKVPNRCPRDAMRA